MVDETDPVDETVPLAPSAARALLRQASTAIVRFERAAKRVDEILAAAEQAESFVTMTTQAKVDCDSVKAQLVELNQQVAAKKRDLNVAGANFDRVTRSQQRDYEQRERALTQKLIDHESKAAATAKRLDDSLDAKRREHAKALREMMASIDGLVNRKEALQNELASIVKRAVNA